MTSILKVVLKVLWNSFQVAFRPFSHFADIMKDTFFVVQIGFYIWNGTSYFLYWVSLWIKY